MYVAKMQKSTEHGDHLTLQGAAMRFGIRLMVMSSKGCRYDRLISGSQSINGQVDILLGHYADTEDDGHYVTLKPIDQTVDSAMASRASSQAILAEANAIELSESCSGKNLKILSHVPLCHFAGVVGFV